MEKVKTVCKQHHSVVSDGYKDFIRDRLKNFRITHNTWKCAIEGFESLGLCGIHYICSELIGSEVLTDSCDFERFSKRRQWVIKRNIFRIVEYHVVQQLRSRRPDLFPQESSSEVNPEYQKTLERVSGHLSEIGRMIASRESVVKKLDLEILDRLFTVESIARFNVCPCPNVREEVLGAILKRGDQSISDAKSMNYDNYYDYGGSGNEYHSHEWFANGVHSEVKEIFDRHELDDDFQEARARYEKLCETFEERKCRLKEFQDGMLKYEKLYGEDWPEFRESTIRHWENYGVFG